MLVYLLHAQSPFCCCWWWWWLYCIDVLYVGRYDLKLPDFVAENLQLEKHLQPILSRLTGIMGLPAPRIRTHNVVFVPVGSGIQEWHVDDSMILRKHHRYFTILIHLNPLDAYCGGTEIWMEDIQKGDLVRKLIMFAAIHRRIVVYNCYYMLRCCMSPL